MDILVLGAAPVRPVDTPAQTNTLGLQLTEGQLIKATVQRNAESFLLLNINGRAVAARSEVPLRSGQEMTLQVAEISAERITLRPVNLADAASISLTSDTAGSLEALLAGWGMEADAANLAIARALLMEHGSISRFDMQALRTLWHRLSALDPDSGANQPAGPTGAAGDPVVADARAMAYLYINRLPISSETMAMARNWVDGPPQLATSLAEMESALSSAIALLRSMGDHSPASRSLLGILEQAAQRAAQWPVPLDSSASVVARRLGASLVAGGIPQDSMLSEQMGLPGLLRSAANGDGLLSTADLEVLLRAAAEDLGADPGRWLQNLSAALDGYLGRTDSDLPLGQALQRLHAQTNQVAADLASVQLANSSHANTAGAENVFLFPLPMATPDGPSTAYLKVFRRHAGRQSSDPNTARLALLFNLPELGELTINLSVTDQRLNGQILSSRQRTHDLVLEKLSELHSDLGHLGYHVEGLTCGKLLPNRLAASAPAGDDDLPADGTTYHINLKA